MDRSIRELAEKVRDAVYPEVQFRFDTTSPDGTRRKLLDVSRLSNLGWLATTDLEAGIRTTYDRFLTHQTRRAC